MADTAIQSALRSLLPSLPASNKPFPPLLLSQCDSLLALSRQRASNLKAEEEIARAHACAEIVCNRLRAQLRLPAIKNGAGAPCKPKVYAKLIKFLEGVLEESVGTAATATPRGRKRDGNGNVKESAGSARRLGAGSGTPRRNGMELDRDEVHDTPSKKRAVVGTPGRAEFVGNVKSNSKRLRADRDRVEDDGKAPRFVMPSIRELCKLFSTPEMVPHIYTGTCVILRLSALWTVDVDLDDALQNDILALVIALYLMVLTRMQEEQMTTEVYTEVIDKSVEALKLDDEAATKIEEWIGRLNEEGWCTEEEWWESVPESVLNFGRYGDGTGDGRDLDEDDPSWRNNHGRNSEVHKRQADLDEVDPEGVLLPGLGTMLYEGIDWTSTDRCLDYEAWHADIMKQLSTTPKAQGKRSRAIAVS